MGAVAFIMAETLDLPYLDVCIAALVPAILVFRYCVLDGSFGGRTFRPQRLCQKKNVLTHGSRYAIAGTSWVP